MTFLDVGDDVGLGRRWEALGRKDDGGAFHKRAHRDGLERPRSLSPEFQQWFDEVVAVWTEVVGRYRGKFLKVIEYIDSVVGKPEPPKDLSTRIPKNFVAYKYLFERLDNPRWLAPLKKHNFFRDPPALQVTEEGGIRAEVWPQAEYLGRMARCDDASVREAAIGIMLEAASTDNYLTHEAFTEAALLMPVSLAAKWAKRETVALGSWNDLPLGWMHDLGKLGSRLACEGYLDAAIGLFSELFDVQFLPQEEKGGEGDGGSRYRRRSEPRFRCDQHSYTEILQSSLP